VNSHRVNRRLSRRRRNDLTLAHFVSGGARMYAQAEIDTHGLAHPVADPALKVGKDLPILLVEIPTDFARLKEMDIQLARQWRLHTRSVFEALFQAGYLVTDFIHSNDEPGRSYYVLCHGESTL